MFSKTLLYANDKLVRAALLVVAPVNAGPNSAAPGAVQLLRIKNNNKIKIFLNIN